MARDGQAGQTVLKESIGHPLLSISPLAIQSQMEGMDKQD